MISTCNIDISDAVDRTYMSRQMTYQQCNAVCAYSVVNVPLARPPRGIHRANSGRQRQSAERDSSRDDFLRSILLDAFGATNAHGPKNTVVRLW